MRLYTANCRAPCLSILEVQFCCKVRILTESHIRYAMQLLGLIGASKLPGVVIPLLSQTVLIWQIIVGKIVLGRDLPAVQVFI